MKKNFIFIRVDIDKKIGSGHFVRCIALAEILKNYFNIYFVSKKITKNAIAELKKNKIKLYKIKNEDDFFIKIKNDTIVVLDGYKFSLNYQKKLKKYTKSTIILDDRPNISYDTKKVINFSFKRNFFSLKNNIYTGLEYFPIRAPFRIDKNIFLKKNKKEIPFVCFGGSDAYNLTKLTVKILLKLNFKKINVVLGEQHKESVDKFKKNFSLNYVKYMNVHKNLTALDIKSIMMNSHFAIVPASTILIELFTIGIPIITGYYVQNQKNSLNYFIKKKLVLSCGNMLTGYDKKLKKNIKKLKNNNQINYYKKQKIFTKKISSKLLNFFLKFDE
jgi:spore coat polysaccharide biosynthesis predicted glycosyltransferase SpsG